MELNKPADVRNLIKKFIMEMDQEGFKIPQPGAVAQLLNIWLSAYKIEKENEIEERLEKLEKRLQEARYGKEREFAEKA